MPFVETRTEGFVGTICLDHSEKLNALCAALADEIINALEAFGVRRVRAVILRARPGVKIWSAGHDVAELPEGHRDPLGWYDPLKRLVRAIERRRSRGAAGLRRALDWLERRWPGPLWRACSLTAPAELARRGYSGCAPKSMAAD